MNEKDDVILEYLQETDVSEPPAVIYFNITNRGSDFSLRTLKRRLKRLRESGLVQIDYEEGRYHSISDDGRAYLAGDLDASKLED